MTELFSAAPLPSCLMGTMKEKKKLFSLFLLTRRFYRPAHTRAISPSVAAESRARSHIHIDSYILPTTIITIFSFYNNYPS